MRLARLLPFLVALAVLVAVAPASAASTRRPDSWCGTHRSTREVALAVHEDHQRRVQRELPGRAAAAQIAQPKATRAGDVAVIEADGLILQQPNPFDLAGSGLRFKRKGKGVTVSRVGAALDGNLGNRLALGDDASVFVPFGKGFRFPFYGKRYTGVFVNSDGNLTFVEADPASSERSVARHHNGPPRIAPFFADLDPSTTDEQHGVFARIEKTRAVFTWLAVPEFGGERLVTFQMTLLKNGQVTVAYGEVAAPEAVVGVTPGGGGRIDLIDFVSDTPRTSSTTLAESFITERQLDDLAIARAFFASFADDYDHLIIWLDFPYRLGGGAFAYEFTLKNEVRGIGLGTFDFSKLAGSNGRLRSFVQMGAISRYRDDPHQDFLGTNSTLDVLGQEAGHRWLAFMGVRDENGAASNRLLGRDDAHWSWFLDSAGSDMEGNDWLDEGGGTFVTGEGTERFSELDQYAMGLLSAAEVDPFFYVADSGLASPGDAPAGPGLRTPGRRVDVTLDQVISVEGERVPPAANAPHTFNMAFVLLVPAGAAPSEAGLRRVTAFQQGWGPYFAQATEGRGVADTTLRDR